MLAALGAAPLDAAGYALPYGGAALAAVRRARRRARGCAASAWSAATDVDNPLTRAARRQQRCTARRRARRRSDVLLLDAALARFAGGAGAGPARLPAGPGSAARRRRGRRARARRSSPCGGRCESGIDLVRRLTGLDAALDDCDLVITGEGRFDDQSLRGKVVAGVAGAARERGLPCVVLAGRVEAGRSAAAAGVTEAYCLVDHFGGRGAAGAGPRRPRGCATLAARLARQWSR